MLSRHLKTGLLAASLAVAFAVPAAFAGTYSGKLNGHGCAHMGTTCPIDRLDPHLALESDFVLMQGEGEYLFLPNVPRSVKVRHVLEDAQITGELNDRYHSVTVDELRVKMDGKYKTVWSRKAQEAELEYLRNDGFWFAHN